MTTVFKRWLPADDRRLRAGVTRGLSLDELAAAVRRRPGGVRWRLAHLGLRIPQRSVWTPAKDDAVRREYADSPDRQALARRLGVTYTALKCRAQKLQVLARPRWTPAQRAEAVRLYGKLTAAAIAARLGKSESHVWALAKRAGLTRPVFRWTKAAVRRLRKLNAAGHSDGEIAAEFGCDRHTVTSRRKALGLPYNAGGPKGAGCSERWRDRVRAKTLEQCRAAGVKNLGQLRAKSYRDYAQACGWPPDLRPREVQILNVLAARGVPMTRLELAQAIGMRTDRVGGNGSLALLVGNGPGGTYTASLAGRGLIVRIRRGSQAAAFGRDTGRDLYTLSAAALAILQERAKCDPAPTA